MVWVGPGNVVQRTHSRNRNNHTPAVTESTPLLQGIIDIAYNIGIN